MTNKKITLVEAGSSLMGQRLCEPSKRPGPETWPAAHVLEVQASMFILVSAYYDRALRRTCLSWVRGCSLAIGSVEVPRTCQDPQKEEPIVGETQDGNGDSNRDKE